MASKIPTVAGPGARAEPRFASGRTAVELTTLSPGVMTITTMPAIIGDLSRSGMRIKIEKLIIFGEIRHCHAQRTAFESGAKICEVVGVQGIRDCLTAAKIELLEPGSGPAANLSAA